MVGRRVRVEVGIPIRKLVQKLEKDGNEYWTVKRNKTTDHNAQEKALLQERVGRGWRETGHKWQTLEAGWHMG